MSWKDYENEPIETLIEYIKWRDQDDYREVAIDAFTALCFRFRNDIVKKCRIICKKWGYDNQISDLIAERTFDRFWKYPKTFTPSKCTKDIDLCLRLYLYQIAQTQLADYKKEELGINQSPFSGEETIIREFPDIDSLIQNEETRRDLRKKQEIIDKALDRLTPKHKIIYLTYKTYEINGHKLPRPLLRALREELDLVQASIQVYNKEANDKVNEYLQIYGAK